MATVLPNETDDNGLGDGASACTSGRSPARSTTSSWPPGRSSPAAARSSRPLVTYLDDVETAFRLAREAAGDTNVLVHGARIAEPVLLGQGRRLFDNLAAEQIELERIRVLEWDARVTHIRYRVKR